MHVLDSGAKQMIDRTVKQYYFWTRKVNKYDFQPSVECTRRGISLEIMCKVELIHSLCSTSNVSEEEDILLNRKLDNVINLLNNKKKFTLKLLKVLIFKRN